LLVVAGGCWEGGASQSGGSRCRAVLAPRCGAFASLVSPADRSRRPLPGPAGSFAASLRRIRASSFRSALLMPDSRNRRSALGSCRCLNISYQSDQIVGGGGWLCGRRIIRSAEAQAACQAKAAWMLPSPGVNRTFTPGRSGRRDAGAEGTARRAARGPSGGRRASLQPQSWQPQSSSHSLTSHHPARRQKKRRPKGRRSDNPHRQTELARPVRITWSYACT